jgi:hypothetical protein
MPQPVVAVSFDADRLSVVGGSVVKDQVRVRTWHSAQARTVDLKNASEAGAWLGSELDKAGLAKSRLVFCVPRGEVVLKCLRLPTSDPAELAGMVRLQMTRQLTMAVEGTAIDYVPITGAGAKGRTGEGLSVLAAALPGDRVEWYQGVAKAAGCKIARLGLRASGTAALLGGVSQRHTGPVLGVAVGWGAVEFVVVHDGELVFTRAADIGMATPGEADGSFVGKVAVEAKRSWMSYRVGEGSAEIDGVVVAGEGALAKELAARCGEALEMGSRLCPLPPVIVSETRIPEPDALAAAPLLGLLAEGVMGRPALDFANPRRAPDLGAARRQRVLAAVLGLIVVGGVAGVYATGELSRLEKQLKAETDHRRDLGAQFAQYEKDDARLEHIRTWRSAAVDWIGHATQISENMPDTRVAQLDQLSGRLAAEVRLTPKSGRYDPEGWQLLQAAGFSIAGHVAKREIADDLRLRLQKLYEKVDTKGADVQDRFSFELGTVKPTPEVGNPAAPAPGAGHAPEGAPAARGTRSAKPPPKRAGSTKGGGR